MHQIKWTPLNYPYEFYKVKNYIVDLSENSSISRRKSASVIESW